MKRIEINFARMRLERVSGVLSIEAKEFYPGVLAAT
jgi:hypothetical protein